MDTLPSSEISVLEPVGAAFDKTRQILFQPFDLAKWFTLGFCAWLATLGESGGGGGRANFQSPGSTSDFHHQFNTAKEEILNNLPVVLTIGIAGVFVIVALVLLFMWLKSRGQFMFLHGVARNVGQVVEPWKRYARRANSLFAFKLVVWLAGAIMTVALIIPLAFIFISFAETNFKVIAAAGVIPAAFLIIAFIGVMILFGVINTLASDFVVPIMLLQDCLVVEGWKRFWALCRPHLLKFILFLLFLVVVNIAITVIVGMLIVFTCCCAACFLIIPYIGTVLLLPIHVWRRAYSALFLAQFGPDYDVFAQAAPVVVPSETFEPPAPQTPPPPPEQNY